MSKMSKLIAAACAAAILTAGCSRGGSSSDKGLSDLADAIRESSGTPVPQPVADQTATTVVAPAPVPCPTTADAKNSTGVDVQRLGTEPCAWVWRGVPNTTTATCPSNGWICTFDVKDSGVKVYQGSGQQKTIFAATWRVVGSYSASDAVHQPCKLLAKELGFGLQENPDFSVGLDSDSGFNCP